MATMSDIYNAGAIFLIGNDVTNQNPLVAWQIRTAFRHHGTKLYVINGRPSKIHRQAAIAVQVAEGAEANAHSLAGLRTRRIRSADHTES